MAYFKQSTASALLPLGSIGWHRESELFGHDIYPCFQIDGKTMLPIVFWIKFRFEPHNGNPIIEYSILWGDG
jgi:hypothetical protein